MTATHLEPIVQISLALISSHCRYIYKKEHAAATQSTSNYWFQMKAKDHWTTNGGGMKSALIIPSWWSVITWLIWFSLFLVYVHTQYCRAVRRMTQDAHDWPWQYRLVLDDTRWNNQYAIQCQLPAQLAMKADIIMRRTLRLGRMSCCMLSQIIALIKRKAWWELKGPPRSSSSSLTLAVLAAGAPAVKTVARVWVSWREAGGRGGERRVGERLPAQGPRVAGGWERCQSVLLRASTTGSLV